ncbi:hypothetical protein E4T50_13077 [Aureobasidium sp. EXF-12298]|nr:hypothetical protein E4T50_13077 [Aureobasidium sp. EXF-12298]KAI4754179.1 hypothetical protein E4T51_12706 [Aureobasidium sp. EXF-12344]KAI4771332.1 hypothetical protein E4T52_13666 [Aureobasidium sp. EXF-3400]
MPVAPGPSRRFVFLLIAVSAFLGFTFVYSFRSQAVGVRHPLANGRGGVPEGVAPARYEIQESTLSGHVIAPKLGNETAKAELGRAAWKLFHTTFARFPDKPTAEESSALNAYIHLFQRLYPCGECAGHFRTILDKFPPQVTSRSAAAAWGCHVHNEVNKSLNKEIFDCSNIGDFYDCGCADGEAPEGGDKKEITQARKKFDPPEDVPLKLEEDG